MRNVLETYLNKVLCMDALELLKQLPDKSVDLVLTDPPYGITQNEWDIMPDLPELWFELLRIGKGNCNYLVFSAQPFTTDLIMSNRKLFKYDLIWEKSHAVGFLNCRIMPLRKHEICLVFAGNKSKYFPQIMDKPVENIRSVSNKNRQTANYGSFKDGNHRTIPIDKSYATSILKIDNESKIETTHPTQKPIVLIQHLVKSYSESGDIVLDPFAGSFTTAKACQELGRNWICCDISEQYCQIGMQRLAEVPLLTV